MLHSSLPIRPSPECCNVQERDKVLNHVDSGRAMV